MARRVAEGTVLKNDVGRRPHASEAKQGSGALHPPQPSTAANPLPGQAPFAASTWPQMRRPTRFQGTFAALGTPMPQPPQMTPQSSPSRYDATHDDVRPQYSRLLVTPWQPPVTRGPVFCYPAHVGIRKQHTTRTWQLHHRRCAHTAPPQARVPNSQPYCPGMRPVWPAPSYKFARLDLLLDQSHHSDCPARSRRCSAA